MYYSHVQSIDGYESRSKIVTMSIEPYSELAAHFSQNSLPGGSFMVVNSTITEPPTCELVASSPPTCVLASSSSQDSLSGCSSLVCLHEEDINIPKCIFLHVGAQVHIGMCEYSEIWSVSRAILDTFILTFCIVLPTMR